MTGYRVHRNAAMTNIDVLKRSKNGPVAYTQVNAGIWRSALILALNHVERIDVLSPVKVEVWLTGNRVK